MDDPLDALVIGNSAKAWLRRGNLLPSGWGLPSSESTRIQAANIRITMVFSPASVLDLNPNPLANLNSVLLVVFDRNSVGPEKLLREEFIAMLLHEIGHPLNKPKPQYQSHQVGSADWLVGKMEYEDNKVMEHEADDYARHCGFGEAIASGLEKLKAFEPAKFNNPEVDRRIQRIRENVPILLGLR